MGREFRSLVYRYMLLLSCLLAGSPMLTAQIEAPGKPLLTPGSTGSGAETYRLPPLEPLEMDALKLSNRPGILKSLSFAVERPVGLTPDSHGSWSTTGSFRVWRVRLVSEGALSLGVVFRNYHLEPGVRLMVYDPGQICVKGAFTNRNNKPSGILPVGHIPGDEIIIEMQVPQAMPGYGSLEVESVSHAYMDLTGHSVWGGCSPFEIGYGCAHECEIDVNCTEGEEWQLAKKSVVRLTTPSQACTGVLVNTTAFDGTAYLLTAEHCINDEYDADRAVFLFNYESPDCFGEEGPVDMTVSGADLVATGDSLDFTLLKLSADPPESYDVYYAGWNRSDFQSSGTTVIHHPWGDVKKISFDNDLPTIPAQPDDVPYSDLNDYYYWSYWRILGWDVGTTEIGSSGAPLFNQGRQVIGLLSGGIARCGDSIGYDEANNRVIYRQVFNYDDYFTRMNPAWDHYSDQGASLRPWLDPLNTGEFYIGGFHPTGENEPADRAGNAVTVYPNPASGFFQVVVNRENTGNVPYVIYDLSGKICLQGILEGPGPVKVFVGDLEQGLYLLRFRLPEREELQKLMISR